MFILFPLTPAVFTYNKKMNEKKRFWLWVPVFFWMGAIYYQSSKTSLAGAEWQSVVGHTLEYGILGIFLWVALRGTTQLGLWTSAALAIGLTTLYGISDEWHQSFVPSRTADPMDVLVDFLAATAAVLVLAYLASRAD
jgi:VanZ family protein